MAKKSKKRREAERRRLERELAAAQAQAPEAEAARLARAKAKAEHEAERLRRKARREGQGVNPWYIGLPVAGAAVAAAIALVVVLTGGGGGEAQPSPTPDPRLGGATPAATLEIEAAGEEVPSAIFIPDTLTIKAGEVTEIVVRNTAPKASHNLRVSGDDGEYETDDPNNPKDDWLLPIVEAGKTGKLVLKMDNPGSYKFQCDFHPQSQKGTLIVVQ